ncbi:MAG: aminopeptidase P family protein [Firmicutes bacterium]|nr:aminopeptidase P family protein [Bacillota bacterium]
MNEKRLENIISNMKNHDIDQLIITSPDSIFYLLNEWIHPGERMLALYINSDGFTKLFNNKLFPLSDIGTAVCYYDDTEDPIKKLASVIDETKIMGIDKNWPSSFLIKLLNETNNLKVVDSSIVVDETRMIKDKEEIKLMKKASEINDKVMQKALDLVKKGLTEQEIGKKLADVYAEYNTPNFSFDPLICFGENAAEPHHSSDDTKLNENECIIIDIGGITNNYSSDMTRSFFHGTPSKEYKKIYNLVLKANLKAIEKVKPGVKFSDIDNAARDIIKDGGYGEYFIHRTGHNIGLCAHEYPDVSSVNDMEVKEGMVFSIEPGIYIPGKYGVRIEDLVIVTKDGCEVINNYPKELKTF